MAREGRDPQAQPWMKDQPSDGPAGSGLLGTYWEPPNAIDPAKLTFDPKKDKTYWEATGKGFYVDTVSFRPNEKNSATLTLTDDPVAGGVGGSVKNIFVNEVTVGMGLNYASGQGVTGKTFYPRDVIYRSATVKGQTVSQHDYDTLVRWVMRSHRAALYKSTNIVKFHMEGRTSVVATSNGAHKTVARTRSVDFSGIIQSIKAGHEKTIFAPEFELQFVLLSYADDRDLSGISEQSGIDAQKKFTNHLALSVIDELLKDVDGNYVPDTSSFAPETGFYLGGVNGTTANE